MGRPDEVGSTSGDHHREGGVRDGVSTGIPGPLRGGCGGLDRAGRRRLVVGAGRHAGRGVRPRPAGRARGVRDGAGQGGRRLVCRHPDQSLSQPVRSRCGSRPTAPPASRSRSRSVSDNGSFGFGLRVLADGAWGFSASYEVTRDAIARAAAEAVEIAKANAPLRREPIRAGADAVLPRHLPDQDRHRPVLGPDRAEARAAPRRPPTEARKVAGVFSVMGVHRRPARGPVLRLDRGERHRAARLPDRPRDHRDGRRGRPQGQVAVLPAALRLRRLRGRSSGPTWSATPGGSARRPSRTSKAPSVSPGVKDLVLLPTHLSLTIHESIGHSTELDRALGYEANYAGTSFLTTDKLGKFRVGSEIVNFNGDRTRPESLSTCGYDDDGVKTRQFPIIKAGIFVGYQTIRDQAHLIGQAESMGCCYADSYASVPFQRMPNVWLEPSEKPVTLDDLVSGVEDGILIDGRGSYSIDQQRYNFQFGGDAFWEIKGGKVRGMIADVAYQSRTPDFWASCDGIGGQALWENVGLDRDGKGQPGQINAMSHGCAPARFRRINVLRTA